MEVKTIVLNKMLVNSSKFYIIRLQVLIELAVIFLNFFFSWKCFKIIESLSSDSILIDRRIFFAYLTFMWYYLAVILFFIWLISYFFFFFRFLTTLLRQTMVYLTLFGRIFFQSMWRFLPLLINFFFLFLLSNGFFLLIEFLIELFDEILDFH